MTVTPTDPAQDLAVETTTAVDESTAVEATADQADFGTDEDLSICLLYTSDAADE